MKSWHMNNISIKGIDLGYIAANFANITLAFVFSLLTVPLFCRNTSEEVLTTLDRSTVLLLLAIVVTALSTVVGGYVAARVAKGAIYLNSSMIGVIVFVLGLLF